MLEIFVLFPGLLGLMVFVTKRSPFPTREYILVLYPPLVGIVSTYLASITAFNFLISDFQTIRDLSLLFIKIDSPFLNFVERDLQELFRKGIFSLSLLYSIALSLFFRSQTFANRFSNPPGVDFVDFVRVPISMVELENGKIYVGKVVQAPSEAGTVGLLTIVVLCSGYRMPQGANGNGQDVGIINYTTFYAPKNIRDAKTDDLKISIAIGHIVSVREFDFSAFEKFIEDKRVILSFPPPDN